MALFADINLEERREKMTATAISNVKSKNLLLGNVNTNGKAPEVSGTDSFSEIFDKTQSPMEVPKKDNMVKTEDAESIQNHAKIQKNKTSEQLKEQSQEVKGIKKEETVEAATMEAAQEMVEKVAETFDITVEEVEQVLETLGLTVLDLLNSENITQVVLALNPECDALSLMTNEDLFADLKSLMNTAQELKSQLMQEFNLAEEEITSVMDVMREEAVLQTPIEEMPDEKPQLSEAMEETKAPTVVVEVDVVEKNATVENGGYNVRHGLEKQTTEKVMESAQSGTYEGTVLPKTEASQSVQEHSSKAGDESSNGNAASQSFQQSFVNQLAEAVENAGGETSTYGVRGQDIINQITEQIKVHVKQDTTEMELQLHPASLGSVRVQLTSAGGVLTAVFTTENEAVKTALEAQLVQLKENFAQQGLKVESVEVNVSAHGFERSLDQQEEEQNRFEDSRSKKGNRRIRLNGTEEAEDVIAQDMTSDDRIVADMMIRNGNTVDYTV